MFDYDPRDRENDDTRDVETHWVTLGRGLSEEPPFDSLQGIRNRSQDPRDHDPRDPFARDVELPSGPERELVVDGEHRYELNGDDSRSLATIGAFRVVPEDDLRDPRDESLDQRDPDLRHLQDEGLVRFISLEGTDRAVTLTERGQQLLEAHRRERTDERGQDFVAGVSRSRELSHDAQLYGAYVREEERIRDQGGEIRRVVLEQELKREYQEWLHEHNRGRADSDGRPDRDEREIEQWAREHDLPSFDESVHFPDFRIEYAQDGRDRHQDVEVVTEHYRGSHAAGVARSGFSCHGSRGRGGGRGFDPRVAEELLR
jgi:hypothetical protein